MSKNVPTRSKPSEGHARSWIGPNAGCLTLSVIRYNSPSLFLFCFHTCSQSLPPERPSACATAICGKRVWCHIYCCCLRPISSCRQTGSRGAMSRIGAVRPCCAMLVCMQHQLCWRSKGGNESEPPASRVPTRPIAGAGASAQGQPAGRGRAIEGARFRASRKVEIESRTRCSSISVCFPHAIAFHVVSDVSC